MRRLAGAVVGLVLWTVSGGPAARAADLAVEKVWPQRLLCAPGQQQVVTVTVRNHAAKTASARLVVELRSGLDETKVLLDEAVSVLPKATQLVPVTFAADPRHRGWEARARVLRGTTVVAEGRDFFLVSNDPWSVAHYNGFLWSYGLNVEWTVQRLRNTYCCMVEQFGQGQAYVGRFIPDREEWVSNAAYRESKSVIRRLVREAHKNGIKVTAYFWCSDFGPDGYEFARQHPEWVRRTPKGDWVAQYDVGVLDKMEDDAFLFRTRGEAHRPGSDRVKMWYPIDYDWYNLDLVRHHASELVRAIRAVGYDGYRYDSFLWPSPSPDIYGKMPKHALSADEAGARNHALVQKVVRKAYPNCLFGYNYGVRIAKGREGTAMVRNPKMWKTVCKGNYMLLEETVALWRPGHLLHDWERYREIVKEQGRHVLDNGGYYYIHLCRAGVIKSPLAYEYQAALAFASRAHLGAISEVSSPAHGGVGVRRVNAFALRFADQIFDPSLTDLPDKDKRVAVSDKTLWWRQYVYTHKVGGHDEWVIHLINPPPSNTPDPAMKETRKPRQGVVVTVTPRPGRKVAGAWAISPDQDTFVTPLPVDGHQIRVPSVKVWSAICVRWR